MAQPVRKTTAKHFAIFQDEARRLAMLWGLNDMKLYFHHGKREARATFVGRDVKRVGTLTLSTHWEEYGPNDPSGGPPTEAEVREAARHEMAHAMLLPVVCLIAEFATRDEAERAEEALVQRLLRILPRHEPNTRTRRK
jgi:hypothetical protein